MENYYNNGPEGMPRVKRMTDSTLNCIIRDSLFSIFDSFEGEDRDRLYGLMHDTAEEVLARLPAWPATPATSAPSGELVTVRKADLLHLLSVKIGAAYVDLDAAAKRCGVAVYTAAAPDSAQQGEPLTYTVDGVVMSQLEYIDYLHGQLDEARTAANVRKVVEVAESTNPAVELLKEKYAKQGEDEPPLPWMAEEYAGDFEAWLEWHDEEALRKEFLNYARTYHAHMMRKLGDGVSVDTPEFRKLLAAVQGWHDGEPVMGGDAQDLIAHIDAKLAQARAAGAERAVPEGTRLRKALEAVRDTLQQANGKKNGPICDTIWMAHGGAETLSDFIESELAAAPSPQEGKAVKGWPVISATRTLPELQAGQDWCCGGCGSGIVKNPKRSDFEYSREEFSDGRVISKTIPRYVAPCCGGELMLWDEAKQDCIPWDYVSTQAQQDSAQVDAEGGAK